MDSSIVILVISVILSAFFSGVEMAFVSSNKFKVELDKNKNNLTGKLLTIVTKSPSRFIGTTLIGNNIALVVFGIVAGQLIEPKILVWYEQLLHVTPSQFSVVLIQTIISTIFILVTAEFLPKAISSINPNGFLKLFIFPTTLAYYILHIFVTFTIYISNLILKYVFKINIKEEEVSFEKTDLNYYLKQVSTDHQNAQTEVENEVKILQNVLDFPSVRARDCMIPRTELISIDVEEGIEALQKKFIEHGHSKIIIHKGSGDHVIGFAHSYDLFQKPIDIYEIVKEILFVPETMYIKDILTQFIQQHRSIALVVDEYGGTAGLITMEDIIEQIFGDIEDELDTEDLIEKKISENEYIFSSRLEIDYINDNYQLRLPKSDEYTTLGGFILYYHQDIPTENEEITIDSYKFIIQKVSSRKIELVKLYIQKG